MKVSRAFPLAAAAAALAGLMLMFPFGISARISADSPPAYEDGVLLVGYQPGTTAAEEDQIEAEAGATRERTVGRGTRVLRVPRGAVEARIAQLLRHSNVRYAEPNYILHADTTAANDASFGQLWGLRNTGQTIACGSGCYGPATGTAGADIDATSAWDVSTGGTANVVGVVDTGIDYTHPDLAPNVWSAPTSFTVTIGGRTITCDAGTHGFNAITNTCDPKDDNNHGTHVSGTIGAAGNNGSGVVGVNWTASIMGLKFLDSSGSGSTLNAINAIEFAIQAKSVVGANVRVLSNSWSGGGFSQALLDEINKANANSMLFVAAAGNNGTNNDTYKRYPASYSAPNIIAVAATDDRDQKASFSNYGANSVHLGAPGVDVYSTTRDNTYQYFSGTSMATPHVSGAAALILSVCSLDTAALKNDILSNVDSIASMSGRTTTGGRLDVNKAIRACSGPPPAPMPPAAPTGLTATAGNAQVSLSWSSSAGAASYNVKRSTTSGGPWSITSTTSTSYTDNTVSNGITYYYVVSARNDVGESSNSNEVSATPQAPVGDFSVSASPSSQSVRQGSSKSYTVTITRSGGFADPVSMTVLGLPAGVTGSFSPTPVTGTSTTLTVTASRTAAVGTFSLTITGTSGALSRTVGVKLTVTRCWWGC